MIRAAIAEARAFESWHDYQEALKRAIAPLTSAQLQRQLLPGLRTPGEIANVLKGTGGTTILLAHDPRRLAEASQLDVQLVLSGHTHGGQVIVPAVGAIAGRKFPVLAGYATRENTSIFVSRGVGTVYVPVRINCPPDVAVLTLRTAA